MVPGTDAQTWVTFTRGMQSLVSVNDAVRKRKEDGMRIGRALAICLVGGALAILGSVAPGDTVHAAPATQQARLQQLSAELEQQLE